MSIREAADAEGRGDSPLLSPSDGFRLLLQGRFAHANDEDGLTNRQLNHDLSSNAQMGEERIYYKPLLLKVLLILVDLWSLSKEYGLHQGLRG